MSLAPFPSFGTLAIHAGQTPDPSSGAVITPISLSTTFAQPSPGDISRGYEYCRTGNPTRNAYEANVAGIENGKHGIAFSSGMAATMTLIHLLAPGDEVIAVDDMYGGTNRYFHRVAQNFSNLVFKLSPLDSQAEIKSHLSEKTKMVWIETPTNPLLKIIDIHDISRTVHEFNPAIIIVVDNTFLSPYFQRPLDLGATIVLHSISKYINGHSDVIGGIVITNSDDLNKRLRFLQNGIGAIQSPFDSFLAMRGIKTLHVRMEQHQRNAFAVARYLETHEKVERVLYPGLESHPQHAVAKKQQTGYGGMVTFFLKGGLESSRVFLENLKLFALAESLGGVESLAEHPAIMTHASVPVEHRIKIGLTDNLVRLSVGIESEEDIVHDIRQALEKVHL